MMSEQMERLEINIEAAYWVGVGMKVGRSGR